MAGLIPQTFLDDLIDRIDIVDVVDPRVKLKKTGKNYSACCPFHEEKTPSFSVSPDKQFYYCFGCGASGNALGFILEYDRLSFPDAVEELAKMAGLEVPKTQQQDPQKQKQRKSLYQLVDKTDAYFRQQLRHSPARQHAVNYLQKRGLSGEIARDFGIGYAPPGWDNLLKALGLEEDDKQLLIDSGMIVERPEDNKRYDRFRNRIMFPIRDIRGRVIAFGGRVLDDSKPKYLNSPETDIFHKGKELYGLYEAKQAYRQLDRVLVVEGYMDVVALAQFGIRYGVATLGTACGEDHLNLAFKHTSEVVFCFDGDNAGRKAAKRALENSLSAMVDGRRVKFLFLPEGEDPDTLIRQVGADTFETMISNAVPLEEFLFDSAGENIDLKTMGGRAHMSKLAAPMLHQLPQGVYRELMFSNLAQRTGISPDVLMELIAAPEPQPQPQPTLVKPTKPHHEYTAEQSQHIQPYHSAETGPAADYDASYIDAVTINEHPTFQEIDIPPVDIQHHYQGQIKLPPQRMLLVMLLQQPNLASTTPDPIFITDSKDRDLQLFCELLDLLRKRPHYTFNQIHGRWLGTKDSEAIAQLEKLAAIDLISAAHQLGDFDIEKEYRNTLQKIESSLKREINEKKLAKLTSKNLNDLSEDEKQQLRDAYRHK
jgi:DNA primase